MVLTRSNQRPAPKIGIAISSIEVFNPDAKDRSEQDLRTYVDELKAAGLIDRESIVAGRFFNSWDALKAADRFAEARVDLVVIANVAFPNGLVFPTLATHPGLSRTPIVIVADPEPESQEWATNAWCGVIMNNYVAKQIGRAIVPIPGPFTGEAFRSEFERVLRVAGTIGFLRRDYLCRFGEAPGGFHCASGDQLAFAKVFGTRVDTVDLTAVMNAFNTGKAQGYLGESTFTDEDVQATMDAVAQDRPVQVDDEMFRRGVRLYHSFRAIVRANGYTSAAIRCWPELNDPPIRLSGCLALGLLLGNRDVTAAACESDWPTAVAQTIGTLLSGRPAACLDWVNHTGSSEIVQLGHCGVGICGQMAPNDSCSTGCLCDAVTLSLVLRQAGIEMGPAITGQFEYGPKTGLCLAAGPEGKFRMLCVRGESSPDTAQRLNYVAADIRVPRYEKLNQLILEYGFPHHLAVAMGDICEDVRILCGYLGVDYISPDD